MSLRAALGRFGLQWVVVVASASGAHAADVLGDAADTTGEATVAAPAGTTPVPATSGAPPAWVNVTLTLHGVEDSASVIQRSAAALAARLDAIGTGVDDPEDLEQVTALAAELNELTTGLERLLAQSVVTLEQARAPMRAMASDVITVAHDTAIDPALERIDAAVTKWLIVGLAGLLVGVAIGAWALIRAGTYLKDVSERLRSIADEYELRPKADARPTP